MKPNTKPNTKPVYPEGADLSEHNGNVTWRAYWRRNGWAAVRVCDGNYHDHLYGPGRVREIRAGIKENGGKGIWQPYGAARVRYRTGAAEADLFIDLSKAGGWGKVGDYPLAYDFEEFSLSGDYRNDARHLVNFCLRYHERCRHWPVLYINPNTWSKVRPHLSADQLEMFQGIVVIWIASWGGKHPPNPLAQVPSGAHYMHQTTNTARVTGCEHNVDYNKAIWSLEKIEALALEVAVD